MLAEAMRFGLPDAAALFAAPEDDSALSESSNPSKAERGRAEGAVLGGIRQALAQR